MTSAATTTTIRLAPSYPSVSHAVSPWLITTYYQSHNRIVSVFRCVRDIEAQVSRSYIAWSSLMVLLLETHKGKYSDACIDNVQGGECDRSLLRVQGSWTCRAAKRNNYSITLILQDNLFVENSFSAKLWTPLSSFACPPLCAKWGVTTILKSAVGLKLRLVLNLDLPL